jgi:MFS family permease
MAENNETKTKVAKFGGMEIPPELTKMNFFFLFFNTFLIGMVMSVPAIIQPALMSDVIKIDQAFSGSINGFLQNMSQIATLFFVALIGSLSDKTGRKILAFLGFVLLAVSYYFFGISDAIAQALNIPADFAATICATVSFMPAKAAEFAPFAPGLLVAYVIRMIIGIGLILVYPQFITMVADYTYKKDRGKGMAANGMSMGFASILVFGIFMAIIKSSGIMGGIYAVVILSAFASLSTLLFLKDRMPEKVEAKSGLREAIPVVKKSPALTASYLCSLITRADIVILATFLMTWGVKYGKEIGLDSSAASAKAMIPLIVMGLISLVAFPVVGVMLDKKGRMPTILFAMVCAAAGMLLMAVSPNPFHLIMYLGAMLAGIGMAGAIAGANTLATDVAPENMIGAIMGGLNTMQPIGVLFFMGLGGYLFDLLSPGWAFGLKGAANVVLLIVLFAMKGAIKAELEEKTSLDNLTFTMEWDDAAKKMLEKVPAAFREPAVTGTEDYARQHSHEKVTAEVMTAFRKELGM